MNLQSLQIFLYLDLNRAITFLTESEPTPSHRRVGQLPAKLPREID